MVNTEKFFNRDMRLFEMLTFIIRIIWILPNIWLMLFVLTVNGWLLKELRNYNESYFCVRHKNRWKHTNILKLLFFTINLHFVTSNQISTNFPLISSIYFVFVPVEIHKRLKKTKVYHVFSYFSGKKPPTDL